MHCPQPPRGGSVFDIRNSSPATGSCGEVVDNTMSESPYVAPANSSMDDSGSRKSSERSLLNLGRDVFLAWERLRIVYLIILALVTLTLAGPTVFSNWRLVRLIIKGSVAANVAYFAGPTIETYVRWLGHERTWPRWVMFGCGTLLSVFLTVGVLTSELWPE